MSKSRKTQVSVEPSLFSLYLPVRALRFSLLRVFTHRQELWHRGQRIAEGREQQSDIFAKTANVTPIVKLLNANNQLLTSGCSVIYTAARSRKP
jgi:hypothetical protein